MFGAHMYVLTLIYEKKINGPVSCMQFIDAMQWLRQLLRLYFFVLYTGHGSQSLWGTEVVPLWHVCIARALLLLSDQKHLSATAFDVYAIEHIRSAKHKLGLFQLPKTCAASPLWPSPKHEVMALTLSYLHVLEQLYQTYLHLFFMPSTVLQLTFIFTPSLMWNCPCEIKDIRFRGNSVIVIHSEEAPQILGQRLAYASNLFKWKKSASGCKM